MIDHGAHCPVWCVCKHPASGDYVTAEGLMHLDHCKQKPCGGSWDSDWRVRATEQACNCLHIDGVWMTRHSEQCTKHPCVACTMRAGHHVAHINIEGLSTMAGEVQVRTCWSCGKQQYMNRLNQWTHVYPANGCLHDEDTRERATK